MGPVAQLVFKTSAVVQPTAGLFPRFAFARARGSRAPRARIGWRSWELYFVGVLLRRGRAAPPADAFNPQCFTPPLTTSLRRGAAWARWPSWSSKPVRSCSPRLGRFDSGAAPFPRQRRRDCPSLRALARGAAKAAPLTSAHRSSASPNASQWRAKRAPERERMRSEGKGQGARGRPARACPPLEPVPRRSEVAVRPHLARVPRRLRS